MSELLTHAELTGICKRFVVEGDHGDYLENDGYELAREIERVVVTRQQIDREQTISQLTGIMARTLHYQDRREPDWSTMDYAATKHEYDSVPEEIIARYRNDVKFHAQVDRAVAMVLELASFR